MEPRVNAPARLTDCRMTSFQTSAPDVHARDITPIVMGLLQSSLKHLHTDREIAAELISKACSLLEMTDGPAPDQEHGRSVHGGLVPWQARRISSFIDANLNNRIMVAELAAMARLGPSHFRRAFKKCFDVSPHAYLMQRRIRRAQDLMVTTDASICEIALAVGFADQAHLTTRFHRTVGTTPHAWRREYNAGMTQRRPRAGSSSISPVAPQAGTAQHAGPR
jgi:AraC family transcriptional regulator